MAEIKPMETDGEVCGPHVDFESLATELKMDDIKAINDQIKDLQSQITALTDTVNRLCNRLNSDSVPSKTESDDKSAASSYIPTIKPMFSGSGYSINDLRFLEKRVLELINEYGNALYATNIKMQTDYECANFVFNNFRRPDLINQIKNSIVAGYQSTGKTITDKDVWNSIDQAARNIFFTYETMKRDDFQRLNGLYYPYSRGPQ